MGSRREFIRTSAIATAAASWFPTVKTEGKTKPRGRKGGKGANIVFIMTDQQRYDALGFMGKTAVRTPCLDELAAEGVHFDRAYCPSPACGPSRASLFTGVYPAYSGHRRNADAHHADLPLFTDRLREGGYRTALVGKRHLHPIESDHGFDWAKLCDAHYDTYHKGEGEINAYFDYLAELPGSPSREEIVRAGGETERMGWKDPYFWLGKRWQPDTQHLTNWTSREACRYIEDYDGDSPYFLNVSFFGPHHPYTSSWPWTDLYDPSKMDLPTTLMEPKTDPVFQQLKGSMREEMAHWDPEFWQQYLAQYYGYVSQIDRAIGDIFNALKVSGDWENTWIIFASDHGDHMGNWGLLGKADPYETSARIPMMIKPAASSGIEMKGESLGQCTNWIDLYGTILDMADLPQWPEDGHLETRSLMPLLRGETGDWKNETALFWGREIDDYSMAFWRDDLKVVRARRPDGEDNEIYNVQRDPLEQDNLYASLKDTKAGETILKAARSWGDGQEKRFR